MTDALRCHRCGQEWARHPCLEVPCPTCGKPIGEPCQQKGYESEDYCREREVAVMAGDLGRCPAGPAPETFDPRTVPCPQCAAPAGSYCRRPSGHTGPFVEYHRARRQLPAREDPAPPTPG